MKYLYVILHVFILTAISFSQEAPSSTGIYFSGDRSTEMTSQLDLTPDQPITLPDAFSLQFDLSIWYPEKYGVIFLMKGDSPFAISLLYDRTSNRDTSFFIFNIGTDTSSLSLPLPKRSLHRGKWEHFLFDVDLHSGTAKAVINNTEEQSKNIRFSKKAAISVHLEFGPVEDPAMAVRNIKLYDTERSKQLHFWKLSEDRGNIAYDEIGNSNGIQTGLQWLAPLHQFWKVDTTFVSNQWVISKPNFERTITTDYVWNNETQEIFIFNKTSLDTYSLRDHTVKSIPFNSDWTSFVLFDHRREKIYNVQAGRGKVAVFDPRTSKWTPQYAYVDPDSLQFGSPLFINPLNGDLLGFGGYGWFTFKNTLCRYNFSTECWDTIRTNGETIEPRSDYGIAEGKDSSEMLIYGGSGSFTGKQSDGEHLLNDLWSLDLKSYTFKRIWKKEVTLFERGWCHLYRVSGTEYIYQTQEYGPGGLHYSFYSGKLYSDSLSFLFDTIQTTGWSEYFFDKYNEQVVQLYHCTDSLQITRSILSTRAYPFRSETNGNRFAGIFILTAGVIALGLGYGGRKIYRRYKETTNSRLISLDQTQRSSIHLFGIFKVTDSAGNDITVEFTPKILQLFLLILLSKNGDNGISTETLTSILWPDSSAKAAKNARGVTINKLRALLAKIGDVAVENYNKKWHIIFGEKTYCDYHKYELHKATLKGASNINEELLLLLEQGVLLEGVHFETIDPIKSSLQNEIISSLLRYIRTNDVLPSETVLRCCDVILRYDALDEQAFQLKLKTLISEGRSGEAKKCYDLYTAEYKQTFDEQYKKQLKELMS